MTRILWIREPDKADEQVAEQLLERVARAFPGAEIIILVPAPALGAYGARGRNKTLLAYPATWPGGVPFHWTAAFPDILRLEPDLVLVAGSQATGAPDPLDRLAIPLKARLPVADPAGPVALGNVRAPYFPDYARARKILAGLF